MVLKEENKNEHQLQLDLGEIIGVLFKTHRAHCQNLAQKLITVILPEIVKHETKQKQKFLLFILDDMVEFLGPDFLGPVYPQIVQQICHFAGSRFAAIRQAAVYGIGMVAQHGGQAFAPLQGMCLTSVKTAIEFQMDSSVKEKKSKSTQFHHARDNAVAALGKVLQYQSNNINPNELVPYWMSTMPLSHDMDEAKIMNKFLAKAILVNPTSILGNNYERLEQFVVILGEVCNKKQSDSITLDMFAVIIANLSQDANLGGTFKTLCEAKLKADGSQSLIETYNRCNQEVRDRV